MPLFRTSVACLAAAGFVYGAGALIAPDRTAAIAAILTERVDALLAPDCEAAPVACLHAKAADLGALADRLTGAETTLAAGIARAAEVAADTRALSGLNQMYLEQGRTLLRSQAAGPVVFANMTYPDRATFEQQLQLYFLEGQRLTQVLTGAETLQRQLIEARQTLLSRKSEVRATLAILPSKIALAEAQSTFAAIETDIAAIDAAITGGSAAATAVDRLLRTTAETAKTAYEQSAPSGAFQAWLAAG